MYRTPRTLYEVALDIGTRRALALENEARADPAMRRRLLDALDLSLDAVPTSARDRESVHHALDAIRRLRLYRLGGYGTHRSYIIARHPWAAGH